MKFVGIFGAKTKFTAICEEVARTGQSTLVSKRGLPMVVVAPVPTAIANHREDILSAWQSWHQHQPQATAAPDFPKVWKMRHPSKTKRSE